MHNAFCTCAGCNSLRNRLKEEVDAFELAALRTELADTRSLLDRVASAPLKLEIATQTLVSLRAELAEAASLNREMKSLFDQAADARDDATTSLRKLQAWAHVDKKQPDAELAALRAELAAEQQRGTWAKNIFDAIAKYAAGDKKALYGAKVPWLDLLLAERDALRVQFDEQRAEAARLRAALIPFANYLATQRWPDQGDYWAASKALEPMPAATPISDGTSTVTGVHYTPPDTHDGPPGAQRP